MCADHPVEQVSHKDAVKFAERMSERDPGHSYSLASEAQLEVVFRGGTTTAYVSGNDEACLGEYFWYNANSKNQTHPVRSKRANAFGIFRSSVYEWTNDRYDANYAGSAGLDPQGPIAGSDRVCRGSSWTAFAWDCRSAFRNKHYVRAFSTGDLGFRLVRTKRLDR